MATKAKATTEATEKVTEAKAIIAKVTKVLKSSIDERRIVLVLDREIDSYDQNGNPVKSNTFSKSLSEIARQCNTVDYIQLADAMSFGKPINPLIASLCLNNASIELKQEFHAANTPTKRNDGSTYEHDTMENIITKIKTNISPIFTRQLDMLISTAPSMPEKIVNSVNDNPFNVQF